MAERQLLLTQLGLPAQRARQLHKAAMRLLQQSRREIVFKRTSATTMGAVAHGVLMVLSLGMLGMAEVAERQRRKHFHAYEREVDAAVAAARKARKHSSQK